MKVIEKSKATSPLSEYTSGIEEGPVVITRDGKPIAALIAIENTDLETVSLSNNQKFQDIIERSRVRHNAEGGISSDEMRRKLGLGEPE